MLESIRTKTKSTYVLFIFGAIILVFIFWGVGPGGRSKSGTAVAIVNGEPIDVKEYLALHKRLKDYYRKMLKGNYTPAVEKSLNLKDNAVSILIDRSLAVMAAEKGGISVSKKEVQDTIGTMEAFQKNGAFDQDTYFKALSGERIKPVDFEEDVRRDLLVDKMRASVVKGVTVNEADIKKAFLKENREINLSYVAVKAVDMRSSVKVADEEAKEYLMEHSTDFVLPAKVKAVYAYGEFSAFSKGVSVSEAEIGEYYEKNKESFTVPEEIHARHILIRPDIKKGTDRELARKAARDKAEGILKRIKGGEDFTKLAAEYSGDPGSAKKGGDLGWFPRGVMMKDFEQVAFALKKGEVSEIVDTPFGSHIIKLEGRKAASIKPLDSERASIKKKLAEKKSGAGAFEAIKALEETFKNSNDVKELRQAVKKTAGLTFHETGLFDAKHFDNTLAGVPQVKDALFLMNSGDVSEPIKTFTGIYLVKVVQRVEARIPQFEEVKDRVTDELGTIKSVSAAKREADAVLKALQDGKLLKDVASEKGLKVSETGFFAAAGGTIPGTELSAAQYSGLFDLTAEKPVFEKPLSSGDTFYVMEWKGSKEADISSLTSDLKEAFTERLQASKEDEKINDWILSLRKKADIQVFKDRM
ncbi:MAG: SurA N-terminal domain-containing protein [Thermodesulfobacteriota bacterium]